MPALRLQKSFCYSVTSIDTTWLNATEDTPAGKPWKMRKIINGQAIRRL